MKLIRAVIVVSFLFAVVSCKKSSSSPSVKDNLVGKWSATKDATDINGNGVMDPNEVFADSIYTGYLIVVSSDGTLSYTYNGIVAGVLSWKLVNNDTYLETIDTSFGGYTAYQHIDNLTSSTLTLRDTTSGQISWTIYTKK